MTDTRSSIYNSMSEFYNKLNQSFCDYIYFLGEFRRVKFFREKIGSAENFSKNCGQS